MPPSSGKTQQQNLQQKFIKFADDEMYVIFLPQRISL